MNRYFIFHRQRDFAATVWASLLACFISIAGCSKPPAATATGPLLPHNKDRGNVYDGTADPSAGWSNASVGKTPTNQTAFLGPFAAEDATLRLNDLPKHDFLHIQADLYIMNTWDGVARLDANLTVAGPDFWSFQLNDRPPLVRAAFSATPDDPGFAFAGKLQSFPNIIPGYPHVSGTGAYAVNELGYVFEFKNANVRFPMDGAYHLDFILPHSAATAVLTAQGGSNMSNAADESWGLTNVKIDAIQSADVVTPSADQMQLLWQSLIATDAIASHDAFWKLVAGGDTTVAFLDKQNTSPGFTLTDVTQRVAKLQDNDPEVSFAASEDLIDMGPAIESLLLPEDSAATNDDAPQRKVLESIELRPIDAPQGRAVAAKARLLQSIATPAAKTALEKWLASGTSWSPSTQRQIATAYHLPDHAALVYLPSPNPKLRAAYLAGRQKVIEGTAAIKQRSYVQDPPSWDNAGMVLVLADPSPNYWTPAFPITSRMPTGNPYVSDLTPGQQLLQTMLSGPRRRSWTHVRIPLELKTAPLHGDWLIRNDATQDELMTDLANIFSHELGKTVSVKRTQLDEVKTVFTGTPNIPAATQPASAANAATIDLYVDAKDRAIIPSTQPIYPLQALRGVLMRYGRPMTFGPMPNARVRIIIHPGADKVIAHEYAMQPENKQLIDQVLTNLANDLQLKMENQVVSDPVYQFSIAP